MTWIAFWLVAIGYFVIGSTRFPTYFKMFRKNLREAFPYTYEHKEANKEALWFSLMLLFIWPYYEIGKWFQNTIIHHLTREEREEAEYQKAEKTVREYRERMKLKEREEREKFEEELRNG